MTSPPGMHGLVAMPRLRRWSLAELLLAGVLLALAAAAWLLTSRLSTPDMRVGILTGAQPMDEGVRSWPLAAALFVATWVVMMAAMMLPSIVPFTVRMSRLMRVRGAHGGRTVALIVGYFLVWTGIGAASYLVLRGFEAIVVGPGVTAARLGAVVLLAAGLYQLSRSNGCACGIAGRRRCCYCITARQPCGVASARCGSASDTVSTASGAAGP